MSSEKVRLVGVGTVSGNIDAEQAAENTLRLMEVGGRRDIPVAVGERDFLAAPFTGGPVEIHGNNGVGDVTLPATSMRPVEDSAAELIIKLSHEYQDSLEIVAVGPLTNLAKALQLDPDLPRRVRSVTVMGGAAMVPGNVSPVAEANIANDPEAAAIVTKAAWPLTYVPLDVTLEHTLEESHRLQLLAAPGELPRTIGRILDLYFDFYTPLYGRRCSALHDPLAAAICVGDIQPVSSPWIEVVVDDSQGPGRGQTIADLRGQRVATVDQPGAHVRMVLDTDRKLADLLVEQLIGMG